MMNLKKRVAVIVCYYGIFPEWMPVWLRTCELNPAFDFFIVTDTSIENLPINVKIIPITMAQLRERFSNVVGFQVALQSPYKLCDYRPLYGEAFKEYIVDYDFWGHCDIDLLWGNLNEFITEEVLNNYDLIGKYGHLMLYRNTEWMNSLFRKPGGTFTYKEVFSHNDNYSFDEMSGMDLVARKNGIRHYKGIKIVNASPEYDRFKVPGSKSEAEFFAWSSGRIIRVFGERAQYEEEFAYIHFSGKKPQNNISSEYMEKASAYLSAKCLMDRKCGSSSTKEELEEHTEFISIKHDRDVLKKAKLKKIKKILKKNIRQKLIWIRVKRGISQFFKNEGER